MQPTLESGHLTDKIARDRLADHHRIVARIATETLENFGLALDDVADDMGRSTLGNNQGARAKILACHAVPSRLYWSDPKIATIRFIPHVRACGGSFYGYYSIQPISSDPEP